MYDFSFSKEIESKVKKEIYDNNLVKGRLAVGVSGGKDSLVTFFILKKLGYKPIVPK